MLIKGIIIYSKLINSQLNKDGFKMDEIKYKKLLGENIRKIRKRNNLTQDAFSEKIGIEASSLSNIENGKSFPSAYTLIQIQKEFKINPQEIFDLDDLRDIVSIEEDLFNKIKSMDNNKKRILWKIVNTLVF